MTDNNTSDLSALFANAKAAHQPDTHVVVRGTQESASVLVIPEGMKVVDTKPILDALRSVPERATGTSVHETLDSLIAHAKEFKSASTAAWLAITGAAASLVVVYDYHLGNTASTGANLAGPDDVGARWCQFGASYAFPIAPEFKAWLDISGKTMSQAEMASFLEDHLAEVASADDSGARAQELAALLGCSVSSASSLLGFARRSAASVNMFVSEKRDPVTGAVELIYQEEVNHQTEDRARIAPPSVFAVQVPVVANGTVYRLPVRIKSMVKGRGITWSFEVYRLDRALKTAVEEEAARFATETGVPVYRGRYVTK